MWFSSAFLGWLYWTYFPLIICMQNFFYEIFVLFLLNFVLFFLALKFKNIFCIQVFWQICILHIFFPSLWCAIFKLNFLFWDNWRLTCTCNKYTEIPCSQFSSMVISCKAVVQYHNQYIDINSQDIEHFIIWLALYFLNTLKKQQV